MPSKQDISPQRILSWNPKIDSFFLPTARPHPLIPLTRGLPPMYWLGTSRWCLGLVCVDTQFCIHNLIKENDLNDQFMYPKNHNCITCINLFLHYMHQFVLALHASFCLCITCIISFITYHKNDLEILTVITVFPFFNSDHWIERYRMIKFAWTTCIVSR